MFDKQREGTKLAKKIFRKNIIERKLLIFRLNKKFIAPKISHLSLLLILH